MPPNSRPDAPPLKTVLSCTARVPSSNIVMEAHNLYNFIANSGIRYEQIVNIRETPVKNMEIVDPHIVLPITDKV